MQAKLALNVKVPRLGKNRLGVFFVRSSFSDSNGKVSVAQLSLRTKDPGLAKWLGLKFCIHLARGGSMSDFRHLISTYVVDNKNGRFEADGEDDHRRAMEAQRMALELEEKRLEAIRLERELKAKELELARIQAMRETPVGREIRLILAELLEEETQVNASVPGEHVAQVGSTAQGLAGANALTAVVTTDTRVTAGSTVVSARPQKLLKDEMNRHLQEERNTDLKAQTIAEKEAVFEDFLTCFGDDIPLNSITKEEVTHRWRNEEFTRQNKKDIEKQDKLIAQGKGEKVEVRRLSPGRIEKRRGYLVKFFNWAIEGGTYKHANPMSQKMFTKKQIENATASYREFTTEDIRTLFSSDYPVEMSEPDLYWIPLMSLYSGARLGELCNLRVETFQIIDGIKVCLIEDGKNKASKRTLPLHSKLLELGLWEYAQALKERCCDFFLPHEPENYRSKSVGRQWGKWVSKCGITDDQKTFHSFRSTAITDMHNAGEEQAGHVAIQRSVGHTTSGASGSHGQYVRGLALVKLKEAIESVDHAQFDVAHLKLADPTFKQFFDEYFKKISSPGHIARQKRKENHLRAKAARLASTGRS